MDRLILLDDVSGVAELSKKFANFLTVSRKFGYNCVYVFHLIIPSNQIWQKIISQTNIFNIFPASVPYNSVSKILQANCISQSKGYVPIRSLWLNRIFADLVNNHEKHCLTIDCGYINRNGPGRFRSQADNPEKQVCYFNKVNDDKCYNVFISQHIKGEEFDNGIYFKIEKLRGKDATENFDAKKTLENGTSSVRHGEFSTNSSTQFGAGPKRSADSDEYFYRQDRKSARLDFSTDDNDVHQQTKKTSKKSFYSSTKVKARNLLTNVSYRRFKISDFQNLNFVVDILSFLLQYFNPINLNRKVDLEEERLMIKFLWDNCLPENFTHSIYKGDNYKKIAHPRLTYQKANKIVSEWIQSESTP